MTTNNNDSARVGVFLTAFAVGAVVGAGMALLYAPRSGKETREMLAQKSKDLKVKAADVLDETKEFIREKKAEINAAFEAGKQAMHEERARHHNST